MLHLVVKNFPMKHGKRDKDISGKIVECYSCQGRGEVIVMGEPKGGVCAVCKGIGLRLVPELPQCPKCIGVGWVRKEYEKDGRRWYRDKKFQCPECEGVGYELPEEYHKWVGWR